MDELLPNTDRLEAQQLLEMTDTDTDTDTDEVISALEHTNVHI